ncbi:MAG: hypothetical protein QXT61_04070, partial [Candidatus Caldarchaeum sp.]
VGVRGLAMVELWFKYGRTEIFADVENSLEILQPPQRLPAAEQLIHQIASRISHGMRTLVIDYVHMLEGLDHVISSAVEAMVRKGVSCDEIEALVTCWRYGDQHVERFLFNHVKGLLKDLGVKFEHRQELADADLSKALTVTPTVYWDSETVGVPDFCQDCRHGLVVTPIAGYGGVVADVLVGEFEEVVEQSLERAETLARYTPTKAADIILVGGPGYPVDSRLSSCINIASSVLDVQPGKVVVFMLECSEGLGEDEFVSLMVGTTPGENERSKILEKRLAVWRKVVQNHKVCLVTALPSTIVGRLLNARQMDTLDQALAYGWRLKSKEATVLAVPNSVSTRLTGF